MIRPSAKLVALTTEAQQLAAESPLRYAFFFQSQAALGGATILLGYSQAGPFMKLDPGAMFGRDVFCPTAALWAKTDAGAADLFVEEDFNA